jgi:hypothetical protein
MWIDDRKKRKKKLSSKWGRHTDIPNIRIPRRSFGRCVNTFQSEKFACWFKRMCDFQWRTHRQFRIRVRMRPIRNAYVLKYTFLTCLQSKLIKLPRGIQTRESVELSPEIISPRLRETFLGLKTRFRGEFSRDEWDYSTPPTRLGVMRRRRRRQRRRKAHERQTGAIFKFTMSSLPS